MRFIYASRTQRCSLDAESIFQLHLLGSKRLKLSKAHATYSGLAILIVLIAPLVPNPAVAGSLPGIHISPLLISSFLILGMTSIRSKRTHFQIVAEILEIASGRGVTKTALVYRANLNFTLVQHYIDFLTSKGMLEQAKDGNISLYRTTQKGTEGCRKITDAMYVVMGDATQEVRIR